MMRAVVMNAPAGLGKTRALAKEIADSFRGPWEVYAATHALAEEWRKSILRFNPHKRVVIIQGRDRLDGAGAALCFMSKKAAQLSQAGFSVYQNLCKKGQGKGIPPLKCQQFETCGYIRQFTTADVYIYTHAHLRLERGALESWQPYAVVIDESFFQSCLHQIEFNIALLTHPDLPAEAQYLCREIANCFTRQTPRALRAKLMMPTPSGGSALGSTLRALDGAQAKLNPGMTSQELSAALQSCTNFAPVRTLLDHLDQELAARPTPQSIDFASATGQITVHHRYDITRFKRADGAQPKIVILDASACQSVISQFFTIESIKPQHVHRNAHVVQCHSTACSTTSLVPSKNANAASKLAAQKRLNELTSFLDRLCATHARVLVVGPSAIVGNARTDTAPLITVPANCELAHFNALRGIDKWKDFDAVVVIGRNEPPVAAVEDIARALYYTDKVPLILTGVWNEQTRAYRTASPLGVDIKAHADPRVQEVVEQLREHESQQAIDRLRLVRSDTTKSVFLLSNLPLAIDVDETRTWNELTGGSRLEQAWGQLNVVLPLNPAWLAGRFPAQWATAEAAKKDVSRAAKKGHFSNSCSIRKLTPFNYEYKHAGQRQWSRCLSRDDDIARVKSELEALTGQPVSMRQ